MQTAEKNAKGAPGATAKNNSANNTQNRPNIPGNEKHAEPAKTPEPAQGTETEKTKPAENQAGSPATVGNQPADVNQPAAAEVKTEQAKATESAAAKPVLSLDAKLKAVDELHRRSVQRLALIARIKTLEEFEVKLMEEGDEIENNPYQGCKLIIQDDKKREFVTMTPGLIRMVAQFIYDACAVKLEEIESTINFPTV